MLLKVFNKALITDTEKTYLTAACAAAATSITVVATDLAPAGTSSNTWSDNDYMCIGEPGQEGTEVMQVNGAVTSATSITIDREGQAGGCRYAHPIGTSIYKIKFNQVEFSHSSTNSSLSAAVLATVNLQLDDEFTGYEDTSNVDGYGFARFKNGTTGIYSSYSDGVNYEEDETLSSRDPKTLFNLRKRTRLILDENDFGTKLTDEMIDNAINDRQRDLAHLRLWTFYEDEKSDSSVANQFIYSIPSNVQKVHGIRFDTRPIAFMSKAEWDIRNWDTWQTSDEISRYSIWNNEIRLWPKPASSAEADALNGAITSSATTITVDDATGFNGGDFYRVKIDNEVIYATGKTSTTLTGCLRGREGTTAAAHLDDAVVTERDLVYSVHVEPSDLLSSQDKTAIPEPEIICYGAAIDLANFCGKAKMIPNWQAIWDRKIKSLEEKYSSKQTLQFGRVKDPRERLENISSFENPNNYPQTVG